MTAPQLSLHREDFNADRRGQPRVNRLWQRHCWMPTNEESQDNAYEQAARTYGRELYAACPQDVGAYNGEHPPNQIL